MKTIKNKIASYDKKSLLINIAGLIALILLTLGIDPSLYDNGLMSFVEIAKDIISSISVASVFTLSIALFGYFTSLKKEK